MKRKSHLLKAVMALAMALFSIGQLSAAEFKEIKVTNGLEFLEALGSDRIITVTEDAVINLSEILSDDDIMNLAGIAFEEQVKADDKVTEIKYAAKVFDGKELVLRNFKNLRIIGDGDTMSKIITEPRYSNLIRFENCHNIFLVNLCIGHTEAGDCMGGVLRFEDCSNIKVNSCDLYGCGVEGITAYNTQDLELRSSVIRDCSLSIMELVHCSNFNFVDSKFYNNGQYGCFKINDDCKAVKFEKCEIRDNRSVLFMIDSPVLFKECSISHNEVLGATLNITTENCKLSEYVRVTWDDFNVCTEDPSMFE